MIQCLALRITIQTEMVEDYDRWVDGAKKESHQNSAQQNRGRGSSVYGCR